MTTALRVLHIVPRFHHGGASASILTEQANGNSLPTTGDLSPTVTTPSHEGATRTEADFAQESFSGAPAVFGPTPVIEHAVVALEPGAAAPLMLRAMRQRLRVHLAPPPQRERELIETADVVVVHFWNTPSMWLFLQRWRGTELRWVLHAHVNGATQPQQLGPVLANAPGALVLTSPTSLPLRTDGRVIVLPAATDLPTDGMPPMEPPASGRAARSARIVHVGTIDVFKLDPAFVDLHAPAASTGHRVVVVGAGGDQPRFEHRAAESGVGGCFDWPGFCAVPDAFVVGAAVFTSPASVHTYATGDRTIQRAQMLGVPAVVYADSPTAQLVQPGVNGWWATDRQHFADLVAAAARGDIGLEPEKVAFASREQHDPRAKAARLAQVYAAVAGGDPSAVDSGCDHLSEWIDLQCWGPDDLTALEPVAVQRARRPDLAAMIDDSELLLAHQRWACEGGLAQYLNAFPQLRG